MPYSGASDPKLPSNVKKVKDVKLRRQWTYVFNGELARHGDEGRAFASANSVLGRAGASDKDMFSAETPYLSPVHFAKEDTRVNYREADSAKIRCGECGWFDEADGTCCLVEGPVDENDVCDLFLMKPAEEAEDDGNEDDVVSASHKSAIGEAVRAVVGGLKSLVVGGGSTSWTTGGMQFYKSKDVLRFVATVTNNFKDRQSEIITADAHREYVEWATHEGKYPELWLWHAGSKSRWGEVDWLDYTDGFVVASGTIDRGKEYIAENLRGEDLAVSHGFFSAKEMEGSSTGYITKYRTFELSPLPATAAANEWTAFHAVFDESETNLMAFKEEKRRWLIDKAGMTESAVASMEKSLANLSNELKARGIDWKDYDAVAVGDAVVSVDAKAGPEVVHHPHSAGADHTHSHVDGTYHSHTHAHPDGTLSHDSDAHLVGVKEWPGHEAVAVAVAVEAVAAEKAAKGKKKIDPDKDGDDDSPGSTDNPDKAEDDASGVTAEAKREAKVAAAAATKKDVTNVHKSKPAEYKDVPDDEFLDSANWKYPIDSAHIKAAHSYFNHNGQREAGGYSDSQWSSMGGKLAKALGSGWKYEDGKVVESVGNKELDVVVASVKALTEQVTALTQLVAATAAKSAEAEAAITATPVAAKSEDDKFADFFAAQVSQLPRGFQASESVANLVSGAQKKEDEGWFGEMVLGNISANGGGR